MKILQINNYPYLKGGSEKVFIDTTNLLIEHGHDVRIFSAVDKGEKPSVNGDYVTITQWSKQKGVIGKLKGIRDFIYNPSAAYKLEALLQNFKPDVIHIHIYYGRLSNSILKVIKRHNIPIVQSVHEYRLLCPAYTCLNYKGDICEKCAAQKIKYKCVKNKCVKGNLLISSVAMLECAFRDVCFNNQKLFKKFIMVSKFIRDKHLQYNPNIADKCEVLYNMIDIDKYADFRVPYSEKRSYYVYVGRLSHEKGLYTLIKAFQSLPELQLKIIGNGPLRDELLKLIETDNIDNVELLGFLSGDELYKTIALAKFSVIPSEWYENNPLSVIESLTLGTPVIGSDIGGIPELVVNGETGFLFNPGHIDSLVSTIKKSNSINDEHYANMVISSHALIKNKCSKESHYKKLINIYKSVL